MSLQDQHSAAIGLLQAVALALIAPRRHFLTPPGNRHSITCLNLPESELRLQRLPLVPSACLNKRESSAAAHICNLSEGHHLASVVPA